MSSKHRLRPHIAALATLVMVACTAPGRGGGGGGGGGGVDDGGEPAEGEGEVGSREGEGEIKANDRDTGAVCDNDDQCRGGTCLRGLPGGYCTRLACENDAECGGDAKCVTPQDGRSQACFDGCLIDSHCRDAYWCDPASSTCQESPEDVDPTEGEGEGEGEVQPTEGEGEVDPTEGEGEVDPPGEGFIGDPCVDDEDCDGPGGRTQCLSPPDFPGGYCVIFDCEEGACPGGSQCFRISDDGQTACLATCDDGCRGGYECVQDLACMPEEGGGGNNGGDGVVCEDTCGPEGREGGWVGDGECDDGGPGAQYDECPLGTDCTDCGPRGCDDEHECPDGMVCRDNGNCEALGCEEEGGARCENGQVCRNNRCVADLGDVPEGPIPDCEGVVDWRCDGNARFCAAIVAFEPDRGPGYWDYPLNGETERDQYRSFIRRDVMQLVKHAAGMVDCLSEDWDFGNQGMPLGLGDMSEEDGSIPGTRDRDPGHPEGTHVNGHDMDIAYHQVGTRDNKLRAVCPHVRNGRDEYHCVGEPENLDVWRTALFIAYLHASPNLRVIGVDGRVGALVEDAMENLCAEDWVSNRACQRLQLAFELRDGGAGWFRFHHHHLHMSVSAPGRMVMTPDPEHYWGPDANLSIAGPNLEYPADPYPKGSGFSD